MEHVTYLEESLHPIDPPASMEEMACPLQFNRLRSRRPGQIYTDFGQLSLIAGDTYHVMLHFDVPPNLFRFLTRPVQPQGLGSAEDEFALDAFAAPNTGMNTASLSFQALVDVDLRVEAWFGETPVGGRVSMTVFT
jgi:hypothetical protein